MGDFARWPPKCLANHFARHKVIVDHIRLKKWLRLWQTNPFVMASNQLKGVFKSSEARGALLISELKMGQTGSLGLNFYDYKLTFRGSCD